jgi:outer membrane lipoprotein SlyB
LVTQPDYGTFCASGDKSTGDYASGSTAKTVTSVTRLYTVHNVRPVAGLSFRGEMALA